MKEYQPYIITAIIFYVFSYLYYLKISKGLGNKATYLQMRRYLPCAILAILPAAINQMPLTSPAFIIPTLTAFLWIITYPTLYWVDNHKVSSDFGFHFEAVFGMYFIGITTSAIILASQIPSQILAYVITGLLTLVELFFFLIPVAQIIYYLLYKSCINEIGMQLLQETHYNETIEFFKSMPLVYNIGALFVTFSSAYLFFANNLASLNLTFSTSMITNIFLILFTLILSAYIFKKEKGVFVRTAIIRLYINVKRHREQNLLYIENQKKRFAELKVDPLGIPFDKPSTIVLVIGESASRDYMQAFNPSYKYDTTPWLSENKDSKNFILFPNSFSNFPSTAIALSKSLTEFNQYDDNEFYTSCSIIDIAHKLGYKVHWYSNQGHLGAASTPVSIVAETSDVAIWTHQELNKVQYDEELLTFLDDVDPTKNNFVVLHLKGSHFNFLNRYPAEFTKFGKPGVYNLEVNYANSIAYTDSFLEKVYNYTKEKLNLQALVYCSDHAQIPDQRRSPKYEGLAILRIPMFTYLSDEYIQKNQAIYDALSVNKNKYWTNDLLYELVCGIFNIKSNKYKEENSIASRKYKFEPKDLKVVGNYFVKE